MSKKTKILYVCEEDLATASQRLLALKDLGFNLEVIYSYRLHSNTSLIKKIYNSIKFRLGFFPERNNENKQILEYTSKNNYDILFIEKGLSIKPSTLKNVRNNNPEISILSYFLDDVTNPNNFSHYFKRCIPLYDYCFTNKKHNIEFLQKLGAKNVSYFKNAFSKHHHKPLKPGTQQEQDYFNSDVSFIGTYEKDRLSILKHIADQGIKVKIWGWGKKHEISYPNLIFMGKHLYNEEYAKAINSAKINLGFLRKVNNDTETTRTYEIPACGGFMLAERTHEQMSVFGENIEAEYFASKEEAVKKIKYYLANNNERETIAINGLNKCVKEEHSYNSQLSTIISTVINDKKK